SLPPRSPFVSSVDPLGHFLDLRSFPTRRSSDLVFEYQQHDVPVGQARRIRWHPTCRRVSAPQRVLESSSLGSGERSLELGERARSEEHTSELQSRFDLVCRLLLEKKNFNTQSSSQSSISRRLSWFAITIMCGVAACICKMCAPTSPQRSVATLCIVLIAPDGATMS